MYLYNVLRFLGINHIANAKYHMFTIKHAHTLIHTYAHLPKHRHMYTPLAAAQHSPQPIPRIFMEPHDFQQVELEWLEKQPIFSVVICWIVKAPK